MKMPHQHFFHPKCHAKQCDRLNTRCDVFYEKGIFEFHPLCLTRSLKFDHSVLVFPFIFFASPMIYAAISNTSLNQTITPNTSPNSTLISSTSPNYAPIPNASLNFCINPQYTNMHLSPLPHSVFLVIPGTEPKYTPIPNTSPNFCINPQYLIQIYTNP